MENESDNLVKNDTDVKELSKMAVRGGVWVFIARTASNVLAFLKFIILARILTPSDFGVMGIVLLIIATIERFSQTGLQQALIQKQKEIIEDLDTVWTIFILRGIVLSLIIFFIAPYIVNFFNLKNSDKIIQLVGFSILLQSFTNIGVVFFYKQLDFKKQFIYQASGDLAEFIVAIILAFKLRNVWALVFGLLAGRFVVVILSFVLQSYRPKLTLRFSRMKKLLRFGKWITGSNISIFIGGFLDNIIVGKLLGAASLGYYAMAYRISNMPASEITYVISQVSFPAYAKIQENSFQLQKIYLRILRLTLMVCLPIVIMIWLLSSDFTLVFLGFKWRPIIPVMQMLAFAGLVKSIASTSSPLFIGSGNPKFEFNMQIIRAVTMIILIAPLTLRFNISGAALTVIFSVIPMFIISQNYVNRIVKITWAQYFGIAQFPLIGGLLMSGIIVFSLKALSLNEKSLFSGGILLFCIGILGIITYFGSIYLLQINRNDAEFNQDFRFIYNALIKK
ncbi:MAG: lipopolysaccharide biosynthesis protein [Candidatus Omnitrophica bacterium]|nr:lipopolysaccharide biosynthesis protein [Candidatus Omnitrophota bacterium]